MVLIIGLGNPGKEYEKTRHNAGFMIIERIKEAYKLPGFEFNKKFNAETSKGLFSMFLRAKRSNLEINSKNLEIATGSSTPRNDIEILLAKPQALMNNSGESVKAIMDFYKLLPENLIVIHDDIDIELGKYKISADSGSAGHKGVQDIMDKLGTQKFTRIRIGIANEKLRVQTDPTDFVLQKFSEEELNILIDEVSKNILSKIGELM